MQTITAEQYKAAAAPKRRKYGNKHVIVGSERFDSMAEARRHHQLVLDQQAGAISDLKRQVTFKLMVNGHKIGSVRPDWTYTVVKTGQMIAEDKKGVQTPSHKIRWKLAKALYPLIEWRLS